MILSMIFLFTLCVQGQEGFRVGGCSGWSCGCLRGTHRGHTLQSGGGVVLLEPGPHMESGMWIYYVGFWSCIFGMC